MSRKVPPSSWKPQANLLDRMLGKELCVLMWAAEHAGEEQLDAICMKWTALRPEERRRDGCPDDSHRQAFPRSRE